MNESGMFDRCAMIFKSPQAPAWWLPAARELLTKDRFQALNELQYFYDAIRERFLNLNIPE